MRTYEKIETIYARDIEGTKKLIPGVFRNPTVAYLKDNPWVWTEKVDGTNIRVCWDGHSVSYGGRTEKASIPAPLVNRLNDYFGGEENAQLFEQMFGEKEAMLFGEGYGKGIQAAGKAYNPGRGQGVQPGGCGLHPVRFVHRRQLSAQSTRGALCGGIWPDDRTCRGKGYAG